MLFEALYSFYLSQTGEAGFIIIPTSQTGKLRHQVVTDFEGSEVRIQSRAIWLQHLTSTLSHYELLTFQSCGPDILA